MARIKPLHTTSLLTATIGSKLPSAQLPELLQYPCQVSVLYICSLHSGLNTAARAGLWNQKLDRVPLLLKPCSGQKCLRWSTEPCMISSPPLLIPHWCALCFLSSPGMGLPKEFACAVPLPVILFPQVPIWPTSFLPLRFLSLSPSTQCLPDSLKITYQANPTLWHSQFPFSCSIPHLHILSAFPRLWNLFIYYTDGLLPVPCCNVS